MCAHTSLLVEHHLLVYFDHIHLCKTLYIGRRIHEWYIYLLQLSHSITTPTVVVHAVEIYII